MEPVRIVLLVIALAALGASLFINKKLKTLMKSEPPSEEKDRASGDSPALNRLRVFAALALTAAVVIAAVAFVIK